MLHQLIARLSTVLEKKIIHNSNSWLHCAGLQKFDHLHEGKSRRIDRKQLRNKRNLHFIAMIVIIQFGFTFCYVFFLSFLFLNATNFQMKFLYWLGDITWDNSEGLVSNSLAAFLHASPPGDTLDNDRLCPPTFWSTNPEYMFLVKVLEHTRSPLNILICLNAKNVDRQQKMHCTK